nr:MAG TPA_asm: hypothetical protein [Caudoviricetes sp.]
MIHLQQYHISCRLTEKLKALQSISPKTSLSRILKSLI